MSTAMSDERPYDWQADVKLDIEPMTITITFKDGEFTTTGGDVGDMILATFLREVDQRVDAATENPVVTGKMADIFEAALRAVPDIRVYGIDSVYLDVSESASEVI